MFERCAWSEVAKSESKVFQRTSVPTLTSSKEKTPSRYSYLRSLVHRKRRAVFIRSIECAVSIKNMTAVVIKTEKFSIRMDIYSVFCRMSAKLLIVMNRFET